MLRFREIRKSRGLSVPQLVGLSGVSRRTIQDLEKRGDCRVSTAAALVKALDISWSDIWIDEPFNPSDDSDI